MKEISGRKESRRGVWRFGDLHVAPMSPESRFTFAVLYLDAASLLLQPAYWSEQIYPWCDVGRDWGPEWLRRQETDVAALLWILLKVRGRNESTDKLWKEGQPRHELCLEAEDLKWGMACSFSVPKFHFGVTAKISLLASVFKKTHQFSHAVSLCLKCSVLDPVSLKRPPPEYPV